MGAVYNEVKYAHHHAPASIPIINTSELRRFQLKWLELLMLILLHIYCSLAAANLNGCSEGDIRTRKQNEDTIIFSRITRK